MKESQYTKNEKSNLGKWGIVATSVIILLWFITYVALKDLEETDRGTLGDMFGTINSLFSGLALAGIIFTILLQREELGYQREELRATRLEFNIQNQTLRYQRFESTFFNLLSLHHKIVENIDLDNRVRKKSGEGSISAYLNPEYETTTVRSRDVFKQKYEELFSKLKGGSEEQINEIYLKFYQTVQTDFGHYFRNLYRIIKFVDETEFILIDESKNLNIQKENILYNYKERYKYISMLRAQLSDYELLWIFYNCISDNGIEKFKPFVEKYALFKNLSKEKIHNDNLIKRYKSGAFNNIQK